MAQQVKDPALSLLRHRFNSWELPNATGCSPLHSPPQFHLKIGTPLGRSSVIVLCVFHLRSFRKPALLKPASERHPDSLEFPTERMGELPSPAPNPA